MRWIAGLFAIALLGLSAWLYFPVFPDAPATAASSDDIALAARGRTLTIAAGCLTCHWNTKGGKPFAGGRPFETPLGTYYSTNITPDIETGIGAWSDAQFLAAVKHGRRPDGMNLMPIQPFAAYSAMPDEDVIAIRSYLRHAVRPVRAAPPSNDLPFGFLLRGSITLWRLFNPARETFVPNSEFSESYNRGAYLVDVLGHCGECHTPRDAFWRPLPGQAMSGTLHGWDGGPVANITRDVETGLGAWTVDEVLFFLKTGIRPDYSRAKEPMASVIDLGLKQLTDDDIVAIVTYLETLPSIVNTVPKRN
ncbi:MAG: c-type cytochrome [Alphaproteobacteria bacterium]|nr:c-type cytochrome [Alphaproteobacteria bacterium]